MYIVDHVCPKCGNVSPQPFNGVVSGDAGIWVCDACDSVYQITIQFERIVLPTTARGRTTSRRTEVHPREPAVRPPALKAAPKRDEVLDAECSNPTKGGVTAARTPKSGRR